LFWRAALPPGPGQQVLTGALILDWPPGLASAWAGEGRLALADAVEVSLLALHAAGPGRLAVSLWRAGEEVARGEAPGGPGWRFLSLAAGADELRWHAPALRLTLAEGRAVPALRLWSGPVAEAAWLGASLLGPGAMMALGAAPPCPHLRLAAGEVARITLAETPAAGLRPVLETLRGSPPLADWEGRCLVLRAGAAWEGVVRGLSPPG
jgi:hypothetical protein